MNDEQRAHIVAAREYVRLAEAEISAALEAPPWWKRDTPYTFRAVPVNPLRLYRPDRVTVGASLNYTGWEITVSAVDPAGWLKVVDPAGDASDLWLNAADVQAA